MTCKYGDPTCPCQDGDACHYEGPEPVMNVPPEHVRNVRAALEKNAADMEKLAQAASDDAERAIQRARAAEALNERLLAFVRKIPGRRAIRLYDSMLEDEAEALLASIEKGDGNG